MENHFGKDIDVGKMLKTMDRLFLEVLRQGIERKFIFKSIIKKSDGTTQEVTSEVLGTLINMDQQNIVKIRVGNELKEYLISDIYEII